MHHCTKTVKNMNQGWQSKMQNGVLLCLQSVEFETGGGNQTMYDIKVYLVMTFVNQVLDSTSYL
jgi:hypothetical protein